MSYGEASPSPCVAFVDLQSTFKEAASLGERGSRRWLVQGGTAAEFKINCVRVVQTFGTASTHVRELVMQCEGNASGDFILHLKQLGEGAVEAVSPDMAATLSVD